MVRLFESVESISGEKKNNFIDPKLQFEQRLLD
jgi:hypothetical protein